MINIDDRILTALNEQELYLTLHIAKRMKASRMTAWPSLATLAADCKWDERTVKRWRDSLVEKGFLSVTVKPGMPNTYSFLRAGIGVFQGLENAENVQEESAKDVPPSFYAPPHFMPPHPPHKMYPHPPHKMYPEVVNKEVVNKEVVNKERETALPLSAGPSESENPQSEPKEKNAPLIAPPPPFSQAPPPPDLQAPDGPLVAVVFAPPTVEHIPTPDGPSFRVETHPPAEVKTIRQTRQKPTLQKKTVEIPATHAEISPLLNELLEKRPYLQKSHDALRREMEWFFSKPVAFCREHIQNSLDRSSGVWDSLKFSGVEETFLRWQRTQERIATPAQQAGPARQPISFPSPIAGERRL